MKVLVACEESQEVCKAFRKKGHEAYSCDIQTHSGGYPEWHIKGNVLPLLNGNCKFITCDFKEHEIKGKWDMIIAHPPCTDLCVSGARYFQKKRENGSQEESIKFFKHFLDADCDKIAIENPIGIIGGDYIKKWFPLYSNLPKCTQIIQPFEYGHPYTKSTCLWLKNLPELIPTDILEKPDTGWINQSFTPDGRYGGFKHFNGSKERSKTFPGIAKAMADQWG